VGSARVS